MFDVGFAELFLLSLIGLLVLGPERLPRVARTVGGFVRKARRSWNSLRHTIEAELAEADISAPIKKSKQELKQIGKDLADISGLSSEKRETVKSESNTEADQKSDPVQESSNIKDENV